MCIHIYIYAENTYIYIYRDKGRLQKVFETSPAEHGSGNWIRNPDSASRILVKRGYRGALITWANIIQNLFAKSRCKSGQCVIIWVRCKPNCSECGDLEKHTPLDISEHGWNYRICMKQQTPLYMNLLDVYYNTRKRHFAAFTNWHVNVYRTHTWHWIGLAEWKYYWW